MTGASVAAAGFAVAAWLVHSARPAVLTTIRPRRPPAVLSLVAVVVLCGAVLAGVLVRGGPRLALVLAGAALTTAAVRRLVSGARRRRTRHAARRAVIELCDAVAAELAAGQPASRAVELACGADPLWSEVVTTARLGGDVAASLRMVGRRPGAAGLNAVAAAWEVAARSGAALADVLDRVASALRDDQEAWAEVSASLAPPRATAKMLAVLPVFGLGLGASIGAHPLDFLLSTPVGLGCLLGGVLLALAGVLWVERLADAAEV